MRMAAVEADELLVAALHAVPLMQVAYRDCGPDPQSGINILCIDRVILTQLTPGTAQCLHRESRPAFDLPNLIDMPERMADQ